MCAALGIQIIPASSPQAKGRIERNHGTQQGRLVKKLRRRGIADMATANAFLASDYWTDHNARFAQPPASADDFHGAALSARALAEIFRLESRRTVSNDWVVRYDNRLLQLTRRTTLPPARSTVLVREDASGDVTIHYRGAHVLHTEIVAPGRVLTETRAAGYTADVRQGQSAWPRQARRWSSVAPDRGKRQRGPQSGAGTARLARCTRTIGRRITR
jgi:hypothetical protein